MPIDLRRDTELEHCNVVDRLGNALPFSKGILATSVLATGIQTPGAYDVALIIQERLKRDNTEEISSEELILITAEEIAHIVSDDFSESYLLWRKARRIGFLYLSSCICCYG